MDKVLISEVQLGVGYPLSYELWYSETSANGHLPIADTSQ